MYGRGKGLGGDFVFLSILKSNQKVMCMTCITGLIHIVQIGLK